MRASRSCYRCRSPIGCPSCRLTGHYKYGWFAIPLGYVFWSVCGLRVALMMPVEPVANWIFKLTEPVDKRKVLTTVVTVMTSITALPIASAFAGAALVLGFERLAVNVFLIVSLAGLCLVELLTLTMKTVPFSCTYLPGSSSCESTGRRSSSCG